MIGTSTRPRRRAVPRPTPVRANRLPHVDGASAVARPQTLAGATYLEDAHDAEAQEQLHLHAAAGVALARPRAARATALGLHVDRVRQLVAIDDPLVVSARDHLRDAEAALSALVLRSTRSHWGYRCRMFGLLLGDVVGTSTAAISLGEMPMLAVIQGCAAGVAAVTAGLAGEQLGRASQVGIRTYSDDMPKSLEPYRHLLDGRRQKTAWLAGLNLLALAIVFFIGSGIYTLRAAIEGSAAGWTFAALSSGIALASFVNSWTHADAIADLLDGAERTYKRALRRHLRLTAGPRLLLGLHAGEIAASVVREHGARGSAASEHLAADKNRALMESPDVVGHGRALAPIGRKPRGGETR